MGWEGWGDKIEAAKHASLALNGKPFAFVQYADFAQELMGFQTGEKVRIRHPQDKGRAANPAAAVAARIPVERVKPPVLLIAGQDDRVWNSAMMTHHIAERRTSANLETVSLIYTDAGHDLGYRLPATIPPRNTMSPQERPRHPNGQCAFASRCMA